MSLISQRLKASASPSPILKKTKSLKSRVSDIRQTPYKVKFALPHLQKVRIILQQYIETKSSREYETLVCSIRDSSLNNEEISSLLVEATECISIIDHDLRLFVEALLSIDWASKSSAVVSEYKSFIVNLLSAHNYHAKMIIENIVRLFTPDPFEPEWTDGTPTDSDTMKFANIHALINSLLSVVPMCTELLISSVTNQFPYYNKSAHIHEYYLYNVLQILEYQPKIRPHILRIIFSKLIVLDVNAPREEIERQKNCDDEIFKMDDDAKSVKTTTTAFTQVNRHSVAQSLDICLDMIFNYTIKECHFTSAGSVNWEKTKTLYHHMLPVFEQIILPTYNTHHVQYIMFLMCYFKPCIAEAFLNFLWKKVCNPNVAPVLRQASVNYIASLVARANFVPLSMLKGTLQQLANWIHSYMATQEEVECLNSDVRIHQVFYSVCQCLFYIVSFRYKDLVNTKKNIVFLESLNMAKMVTSRLNPLRVCQPAVVQNFAAITRNYQLAYCYSVIEHNSRNVMPVIYQNEKGSVVVSKNVLDVFYPFDPYLLERSGEKIHPYHRDYEEVVKKSDTDSSKEELAEVDDFLYTHEVSTTSNSKSQPYQFSYGSSPGFKFKS